jgi:hypothetical protein
MPKLVIKNDGRGSEKSFSSVLDLGSIVVCGNSVQQVQAFMIQALGKKLEALFTLDLNEYVLREEERPAWLIGDVAHKDT